MPFNVSGISHQTVIRLGVVSDGAIFTTDGYGAVVTSALPARSIFASVPVRASTGLWSVPLKEAAGGGVLCVVIHSLLSTGNYLGVQLKPTTTTSAGNLVLNWVFNNAGTPADLPASGQMEVWVMYSETSGQ